MYLISRIYLTSACCIYTTGIVGPIIVFATVIPRFAFFTTNINDSSQIGAEWVTFMFSPTACAFGADVFMQFEGANIGLGWNDINQNVLSMSSVLLGELFDFIIYSLLALYFEQVVPNEVCVITFTDTVCIVTVY